MKDIQSSQCWQTFLPIQALERPKWLIVCLESLLCLKMKLLSIRRFPSSTAWWITIWHFSAFMIEEMTFRYCNFFFLLTTCPIFSFPHANISQISNLLDVNLVLIWVRGLFLSFNDSFVDIKWLYKKKKTLLKCFCRWKWVKKQTLSKEKLEKDLGKVQRTFDQNHFKAFKEIWKQKEWMKKWH